MEVWGTEVASTEELVKEDVSIGGTRVVSTEETADEGIIVVELEDKDTPLDVGSTKDREELLA